MARNIQLSELIDLILTIKTRQDLGDFLLGILTPKELEEIPTRLQIVKMLKKGAFWCLFVLI